MNHTHRRGVTPSRSKNLNCRRAAGYAIDRLEPRRLLAASLIQDGGFETPVVTGSNGYDIYQTGATFGPWTVVGASGAVSPLVTGFTQNGFSFQAESGSQSVDLAGLSNTATGVSQTIPTTAGTSYTLKFSVGNVVDATGLFGSSSAVQVLINSVPLQTAVNSGGGNSVSWMPVATSFTATGPSTAIAFINGDPHSDNYNGLDDVSVDGGAQLAFVQPPNDTAAGDVVAPPVTVAVEDAQGNFLTASTDTITITAAGNTPTATGVLTGTTSVAAVNGIATFSDLSIDTKGSYTLTAADTAATPVTSPAFNVTPGKLVYLTAPADGAAETALNPAVRVALEDGKNNIITTDSSTVVELNPVGFTAGNPIKGNSVTLNKGIATFDNLSLTKPGFYTLQATDGVDAHVTSAKFKITGDHLVIGKQPPAVSDGGAQIPFTVKIVNSAGKLDKTATSSAGISLNVVTPGNNPMLSGTLTAPFVGGIATFKTTAGPAIDAAGTYNFTVTEEELSTGVFVPTNTSVPVNTADFKIAGASLKFVKQPKNGDVNQPIPLSVALVNQKGQVDRTQNGPGAVLTLNPAAGAAATTLGGITTGNFVNGVAAFTTTAGPTVGLAGTYTLTATDPALPGVAADNSNPFKVAGFHLMFKKQVTQAGVGAPILFTVALLDSKNKPVTTENSATVTLDFTAKLGGANAKVSGTLVRTLTAGVADFTAAAAPQLDTAGVYRFTATETGTPSVGTSVASTQTGQSNPVTIAADHLIFLTAPPASSNANSPFTIGVAVVDKKGNRVVAQNSDLLQLALDTVSGGTGAVLKPLVGNLSPQQLAFGATQFMNLFVNAPGTYTITATQIDAGTGAASNQTVPLVSKQFKVEGLHVAILTQPGDVLPYQPVVMKFALEDSKNKIDTTTVGYFVSESLATINGGAGASVVGAGTSFAFTNGIADLTVNLGAAAPHITNNPGTFAFDVTATSAVPGAADVVAVKTKPFKVLPLHLAITQQPADTTAYGRINLSVSLQGPNNKVDVYDDVTVPRAVINAVSGGAGAQLINGNAQVFSAGVANFTNAGGVGIDTPGTYTMTVTENSLATGAPVPATPAVTTTSFKVSAIHMVITTQPANVATNAPVSFVVGFADANNTPVTGLVDDPSAEFTLQPVTGTTNTAFQGVGSALFLLNGVLDLTATPLTIAVPGTYQFVVTFQPVTGLATLPPVTTSPFTVR